jgi:hypothetical protein
MELGMKTGEPRV